MLKLIRFPSSCFPFFYPAARLCPRQALLSPRPGWFLPPQAFLDVLTYPSLGDLRADETVKVDGRDETSDPNRRL